MPAQRNLSATSSSIAPEFSAESLHVLNVYLDELVSAEYVGANTEVMLRRIAPLLCSLAGGVEVVFAEAAHPARDIMESLVKVGRLTHDSLVPGESLFQTIVESIDTLKRQPRDKLRTLSAVRQDLAHAMKLAMIKAPASARSEVDSAGRLSAAKIHASMLIMRHARRFSADDALLYFSLTQWLELVVVLATEYGIESAEVKNIERATFTLFYLDSDQVGARRQSFLKLLLASLDESLKAAPQICMGHPCDFSHLRSNLFQYLRVK